ncbi:MAG: hypothetical protein Q9179_007449 [Wetmoreana sp. 5 TL-2023]
MEPLSTTASFLAILEATIFVGKATAEFCHDIREAPKELSRLSSRILQTQSRLKIQLHLHQSLSNGNLDAFLTAEALKTLETDLKDVKTCLGVIQGSVPARADQSNAHQRLGWVLHEKRKVKKLLQSLRDVDMINHDAVTKKGVRLLPTLRTKLPTRAVLDVKNVREPILMLQPGATLGK